MSVAAGPDIEAVLLDALGRLRRGDPAGARSAANLGLRRFGEASVLHAFVGMIACRLGDLEEGIGHLRTALSGEPGDAGTRANLAHALLDCGNFEEVLDVATAEAAAADPSMRLWRLRGFAAQQRGEQPIAIEAYRRLVDADPRDAQSWNNLGNALAASGDAEEALAAIDVAVRLLPDDPNIRRGHALAVGEAGDERRAAALLRASTRDFPDDAKLLVELGSVAGRLHLDEEAIAALERAITLDPSEPRAYVRLGEQRFSALQPALAEAAFLQALRVAPGDGDAHVQLALLYEHLNRRDDLDRLVIAARVRVTDTAASAFMEALAHRRAGRFKEALEALETVPEDFEPGRRTQIIGQCQDRLGDTDAAFAAFSAMNGFYLRDPTEPQARAARYRGWVRRVSSQAAPENYNKWPRFVPPVGDPAAPVFLLGFPRSGTTLLDTLLMGHPDVTIMEELPILHRAETMIGREMDLAKIGPAAVRRAREGYYTAAREIGGWSGTTVLIDKHPLHTVKAALIHRLFPDARFLLALRHPCDVVLSCFTTAFKLNDAMANFLELETTAKTYDLVFSNWEKCRATMPLNVVTVRYEDVVADTAAALRPVLEHIGLDWRPEVLDHRATAKTRGHIATASYAQVTEPVYGRATGRWRRYERQLAPVIPILAPWVKRFGYTL